MPSRNVILIIGPPGAGKTTYAQQTGLPHLEREHYPTDQDFTRAAQQATAPPNAQAAIVRCCPTLQEQHHWEQLTNPTRTIILDPGPDECARRIHQRHRPNWKGEAAAARNWRTTRTTPTRNHSRHW